MFKYDPRQKSHHQIERTFYNGRKYLSDILDDLTPKSKTTSTQCIIVTGQRGMGKSHFITMLYYSIKSDTTLKSLYLPILFPEELYTATNLFRFLKEVISRIYKELPKDSSEELPFYNEYVNITKFKNTNIGNDLNESYINVESQYFDLINKLSNKIGKKIVLLLENLHELLGKKFNEYENKRFRAFLQTSQNSVILIGTAVTIFENISEYGQPFFNFFKFRHLSGLSSEDILKLLFSEGEVRNNPNISMKINKYKGQIELFRLMTGGNPRLVLFLYDLLTENEEFLTEDILHKVTEMTPYFKAEIDLLSEGKQLIMDALCVNAPAQSASEIAEYTGQHVGVVSENIKRLVNDGKIKAIDTSDSDEIKKSETFYTITDYFYRIWYQIRQSISSEENLKWMSEFILLLYDEIEIKTHCNKASILLKPIFENAFDMSRDESLMNGINRLKQIANISVEKNNSEYTSAYQRFKEMINNANYDKLILETNHFITTSNNLRIINMANLFKAYALFFQANYIESLTILLELNVDSVTPQKAKKSIIFFISYCYLHTKMFFEAAKYYLEYLENIEPTISNYKHLVKIYIANKNFDSAFQKIEEMKKNIPSSISESYAIISDVYFAKQDYENAIENSFCALEINRNDYISFLTILISLSNISDLNTLSRYVQLFDKLIQPSIITQLLKEAGINTFSYIATNYSVLGAFNESIKYSKLSLDLEPFNQESISEIIYCYIRTQNYSELKKYLLVFLFKISKYDTSKYLSLHKLICYAAKNIFNQDDIIEAITSQKSTTQEKLEEIYALIYLGKFDGIVFDLFNKTIASIEKKDLQRYLVTLNLVFLAETITRIHEESPIEKIAITAKCYFATALLTDNDDNKENILQKQMMDLLLHVFEGVEKKSIVADGIKNMLKALEEEQVLKIPEIVYPILATIKKPTARIAKKWSSDPLFSNIIDKINKLNIENPYS